MAIDVTDGKVKWEVERPGGRAGYGTPLIYRPVKGGRPQLVVSSTAAGIAGYDLGSGKPLWAAPDANPLRVVASPVQVGDLVVGTSGSGGRGKWIIAVRPPKAPDGKAQTAWKLEEDAHYVPTPIAVGELLFTVHDSGLVACYRAATGDRVWKAELEGRFYGSPVLAGGRIYVINRAGVMYCYGAGETFKLLGKTDLGEPSFATPAFAGRKMLLRTHTRLICAEKK
jgi:outer membrane protein assembly factor BamB